MTPARLCLAFGILTLVLAVGGIVTTPKTCGDDHGLGPILALEFATSAQQVQALVNTPECAAAQREATLADMAAFIPSFTGFLICGALVVRRTRRAAKWAVPMFIVAALSDEVEDTAILRLLENPADAAIGVLIVAVRLKFLMLTLGVLVARAERVAGAFMVLGGAVALTGLMFEPRILMPATLVAWVALFVSVARSR